MKTLVPCLLLALLGALSLAQVPADLVLINGKIWAVNPARPQAEAVACSGGLITAVGTTAQILPLAVKGTRVVELHGRLAVPGFNDAHVHLIDGATPKNPVFINRLDGRIIYERP
jgi:predicted amidohydrolase YtcJ